MKFPRDENHTQIVPAVEFQSLANLVIYCQNNKHVFIYLIVI